MHLMISNSARRRLITILARDRTGTAKSVRMCLGLRLAIVLALALTGCAAGPWPGFPTPRPDDPRWPPPPEVARIAYVTQLRSHEDLFQVASRLGWLGGMIFGQPDSTLVRPYALALHPEGGLLVADPGRQCVHYYDWNRRRYIVLGRGGQDIESVLPSPVGVAALADGRILVCDSRLGRIEAFDSDGNALGEFGAGAGLARPAGIAVSQSAGGGGVEIYVADVTGHRIAVFDLAGNLVRWIGERGAGPCQFNFPTHITVMADGRLAVTDSLNFRVQVIEPDGTFVRQVGSLGDSPGRFSKPKGVAADSSGRIMVVEGLYDRLQIFSPTGELLLDLGMPGSEAGQFWLPAGICIDRDSGRIFIADTYNSRVQVFEMIADEVSHD